MKHIVEACKYAWENNAKELWITSEDKGVYGRDIGTFYCRAHTFFFFSTIMCCWLKTF